MTTDEDDQVGAPLRVVSDSRPRLTEIVFPGPAFRTMELDSRDGWVVEVTAAYVVASRFNIGDYPDDPDAEPFEVWCWPHTALSSIHTTIPEDS